VTSADQLDPYTVRLHLSGRFDHPCALVASLLEDVARSCDLAGASLIGHLKAHARTSVGSFHCNLTSMRSGARCAGPLAEHPAATDSIDLDLAVLVYGLPRHVVAGLVEEAAERLRDAGLTDWALLPTDARSGHPLDHDHTHDH
jgi:hypothetical protein